MITLAGASAMPVLRPQYLILVIFDDFRARFESTSRYRTKMVRIVSEMSSKVSPGLGGPIGPIGNINTKISRKTANAGKFARMCRFELTFLGITLARNQQTSVGMHTPRC